MARLIAPARLPLRARNHHLLTSSTAYSCSASQEPEQLMLWLMLPVNKIVPGSTVCQQLRPKPMARSIAWLAWVANVTQSSR